GGGKHHHPAGRVHREHGHSRCLARYLPDTFQTSCLPSGRLEDVRLEVWLRSTTTEAQALAKLTREPLGKQLVAKYLETTLSELAALAENRSVDSVGEWLVIGIGAPKAD